MPAFPLASPAPMGPGGRAAPKVRQNFYRQTSNQSP